LAAAGRVRHVWLAAIGRRRSDRPASEEDAQIVTRLCIKHERPPWDALPFFRFNQSAGHRLSENP